MSLLLLIGMFIIADAALEGTQTFIRRDLSNVGYPFRTLHNLGF
jgi:hypothetical protein